MLESIQQLAAKEGIQLGFSELRDVLWLALHLQASQPPRQESPPASRRDTPPAPRTSNKSESERSPEDRLSSPNLPTPPLPPTGHSVLAARIEPSRLVRSSLPTSWRKSLKAFKGKRESGGRVVLDEARSAEATAEARLPWPIFRTLSRPSQRLVIIRERRLGLWGRQLAEVLSVLQTPGAFRSVLKAFLTDEGSLVEASGLRLSEAQLGVSEADVLYLVVSDFADPLWEITHWKALRHFHSRGNLAILQPLPQRL